MINKDYSLTIKVEKSLRSKYKEACDNRGHNGSELIRKFMAIYISWDIGNNSVDFYDFLRSKSFRDAFIVAVEKKIQKTINN